MASKYRALTPNELRTYIRRHQTIVWGAAKKGRGDEMPLISTNMRFPGKKTRLLRGMIEAVSGDGARCKIADDRGPTYWVSCDALLFYPERID